MTLKELADKDIVDIKTGVNYGKADDLEFDPSKAFIQRMILHGRLRLFGILGREKDVYIDWSKIITIGEDAILVDVPTVQEQETKALYLKKG